MKLHQKLYTKKRTVTDRRKRIKTLIKVKPVSLKLKYEIFKFSGDNSSPIASLPFT